MYQYWYTDIHLFIYFFWILPYPTNEIHVHSKVYVSHLVCVCVCVCVSLYACYSRIFVTDRSKDSIDGVGAGEGLATYDIITQTSRSAV